MKYWDVLYFAAIYFGRIILSLLPTYASRDLKYKVTCQSSLTLFLLARNETGVCKNFLNRKNYKIFKIYFCLSKI